MPPPDHSFAHVTRAALPMLRRWLSAPHVRTWWGTPGEELALMQADLGRRPTDMRIVHRRGRPFVRVRDYPAHGWLMPHWAKFPRGTRAVDTFPGDPAMRCPGHAGRYGRQRAEDLVARGYPRVVIDPDPESERAVRAFRRAGVRGDRIVPCEDGDPVIVMEFDPA
jgi:aminoglycoside 6'-N-acetyltransferase